MPDWTRSMQQTFDFLVVNPRTWADDKKLTTVTNATITRDLDDETLGSASIDCDDDLTDLYIRIYLKTIQDRVEDRIPLGTYLCQTPGKKYDGKRTTTTADGYTPLIELKEKLVPLGYAIYKGENILDHVYNYTRESVRARVMEAKSEGVLKTDFVSDVQDTRLTFIKDLLANDKRTIGLDEWGRIIFPPVQKLYQLQPRWTYDDNNSSILYPDLSLSRDLYGVPNVVEVLYSGNKDAPIFVRIENNDPESVTSIQARGREIVYRETNPTIGSGSGISDPDVPEHQVKEYAIDLLRSLSSLEYTLEYKHGYCPVNIGDGVRLNYTKAGILNRRAKVTRQIINCVPGCPVQETAVFTKQLWTYKE